MTTERWSARTESGGRILPLVILSLAAIASPLLAQESIPVPQAPVGSRVRVWTLYENLGEARVLAWGDSTLVLAPAHAEADSLTVPFRAISKLQVSWGRDVRRGIARGALFGSGAGIERARSDDKSVVPGSETSGGVLDLRTEDLQTIEFQLRRSPF